MARFNPSGVGVLVLFALAAVLVSPWFLLGIAAQVVISQ